MRPRPGKSLRGLVSRRRSLRSVFFEKPSTSTRCVVPTIASLIERACASSGAWRRCSRCSFTSFGFGRQLRAGVPGPRAVEEGKGGVEADVAGSFRVASKSPSVLAWKADDEVGGQLDPGRAPAAAGARSAGTRARYTRLHGGEHAVGSGCTAGGREAQAAAARRARRSAAA